MSNATLKQQAFNSHLNSFGSVVLQLLSESAFLHAPRVSYEFRCQLEMWKPRKHDSR